MRHKRTSARLPRGAPAVSRRGLTTAENGRRREGQYFSVGTITLRDSIIMIPRVASPITVQAP
jgi:hypothetical protein